MWRRYDLTVYGPNRYLRHFRGAFGSVTAPEAKVSYVDGATTALLTLTNSGARPVIVIVEEQYSRGRQTCAVPPGKEIEQRWPLEDSSGWYDLAITSADQNYLRRFAGHVENGQPSTSDPASSLVSLTTT